VRVCQRFARQGPYDCRVYTQIAPVTVFEADTAAIFRNNGFLRAVLAVKSAIYGF